MVDSLIAGSDRDPDSDSLPQIVGIILVRNEDIHIHRVLSNILGFCDRVIVADNRSDDNTAAIVKELALGNPKVEYHLIGRIGLSHGLISHYAGRNVWVFAVDGDEIYDPVGLSRFRSDLLSGKFDCWWMIFGNVLNCVTFDRRSLWAAGYLAPPCRSMTKLYNFKAIDSWHDSSGERLHGGDINFRRGYDNSQRLNLADETTWEEADFRCLHMCFLQRSSTQKMKGGAFVPRPNPADIMSRTLVQRAAVMVKSWFGIPDRGKDEWKIEKFTRGDQVEKDVSAFFPSETSPLID